MVGHSRVGVSVQAQEVNLRLRSACRVACLRSLQCTLAIQGQSRAVSILIGVEEDVGPIIFVVTDSLARDRSRIGNGGHTLLRIGRAAIAEY